MTLYRHLLGLGASVVLLSALCGCAAVRPVVEPSALSPADIRPLRTEVVNGACGYGDVNDFAGCYKCHPVLPVNTVKGCVRDANTRRLALAASSRGQYAASVFSVCRDCHGAAIEIKKPVIYLYPERTTAVSVHLDVDGWVTLMDPPGRDTTWRVRAEPTGQLTDPASGHIYPYLFWEASIGRAFNMSTGSVVAGRDTRAFLRRQLSALGLNQSETAAFMDYWAPRMEGNAFNLIHFEGPAYEQAARLDVTPAPDMSIRVFMAYSPLSRPVDVRPQELPRPPARHGFVLVEWGGAELPSGN